jgi:hypothetical protein
MHANIGAYITNENKRKRREEKRKGVKTNCL